MFTFTTETALEAIRRLNASALVVVDIMTGREALKKEHVEVAREYVLEARKKLTTAVLIHQELISIVEDKNFDAISVKELHEGAEALRDMRYRMANISAELDGLEEKVLA